jgi:tetratricopeptide (TPR) repeat protein
MAMQKPTDRRGTSRIALLALSGALLAPGVSCREDAVDRPEAGGSGQSAPTTLATAIEPDEEPLSPELTEIFRLIQAGRSGPARVRLVKHERLHPEDGRAAFLFALSYHEEKRYGEARLHYERAAELAPGYPPVHYFDGWCLFYIGRLEEARAAFERHLALAGDTYDTQFGLGLIDLEEARLDEAEARFRRALELQGEAGAVADREQSKVYTRLGDVSLARGADDEARRQLEEALELMPDNGEAAYKLYRLLLRLGLETEAEAARAQYEATLP